MGYTHYWKYNKNECVEDFKKAVPELKKVLEKYEDLLADGLGNKGTEPRLTETGIWFNGIEDNSHETFSIDSEHMTDFEFCKTVEKPYDLPVCECLLILEHHIPGFKVTSDGIWEEDSKEMMEENWKWAIKNTGYQK